MYPSIPDTVKNEAGTLSHTCLRSSFINSGASSGRTRGGLITLRPAFRIDRSIPLFLPRYHARSFETRPEGLCQGNLARDR